MNSIACRYHNYIFYQLVFSVVRTIKKKEQVKLVLSSNGDGKCLRFIHEPIHTRTHLFKHCEEKNDYAADAPIASVEGLANVTLLWW